MLPFTVSGSGASTLVLMPFLGGSQREWTEVVAVLGAERRCITVDLPGFGAATDTPGYSVEEMAGTLIETIVRLGLSSYLLVGHSMAGKVSAVVTKRLMADSGPVVPPVGLVLVSPSPPSPEPMTDAKRAELLAMFGAVTVAADRKTAERFIAENVSSSLTQHKLDRTVDDVLRMNRAAWVAWLEKGSREDWSDFVGVLQLPVLIVAGEQDGSLGPAAQRKSTVPHFVGAELAVLDCSHLAPLERPEELARLISKFISNLEGSS